MIAEEFPLKNGERLRIATSPIRVGEGVALSAEGVNPDIVVRVAPEDDASIMAMHSGVCRAQTSFLPVQVFRLRTSRSTNRARRTRFNEAELVRERREGTPLDADLSPPREAEPDKPVVRDPSLARALDVLKVSQSFGSHARDGPGSVWSPASAAGRSHFSSW